MRAWAGVGEAYAASYAALCAGTIDALAAELGSGRGRSLLDVGAGTGLLAAHFTALGWDATGCEPESTMRAVAARAHPEVPFVHGALPDLPFGEAEFDAVTANFVLNHVDDPRRSARELARVSADLVAASIWVRSPSWLWREVCERAGLLAAAGERLAPEKDFERDAEGFAGMLRDGGWREVVVSELTWTWQAEPAALWASAEGGVASAGAFYRALDESGRRRFRGAFDELCAERAVDGVVALPHTAAIASGHRG